MQNNQYVNKQLSHDIVTLVKDGFQMTHIYVQIINRVSLSFPSDRLYRQGVARYK